MNLNDLIIIYLACGAPFGVYYFLQNRNLPERKILYLKTLLGFLFWIPLAVHLVARSRLLTKIYKLEFAAPEESDAKIEQEIFRLQKKFEKFIIDARPGASVYDFRETFERYTGLTLELAAADSGAVPSEKEIFRISGHDNKRLGEICLHRRNRRRLLFHQISARRDFVESLAALALAPGVDRPALLESAARLFSLLDDFEANNSLAELSNKELQSQPQPHVSHLERELWNVEKQPPPSPASQISTNLPVLTATAKLSGKD